MKYDDLLNVPYKPFGRSHDGMDCYGLILEMCRRNGTPIRDIVYPSTEISNTRLNSYIGSLNVKPIDKKDVQSGDLMECDYENTLHVGYMLDNKTVIHATRYGVRITPVIAFKKINYYRVIKK